MSVENLKIAEIIDKYPFVMGFFESNNLNIDEYKARTFKEYLLDINIDESEEYDITSEILLEGIEVYIKNMLEFLGLDNSGSVEKLTILPGQNKFGEAESFERVDINKSQVISIVGPTGSGKSRLLGDIEWIARKDTPTKRTILINDELPDTSIRFNSNKKLVAQLSQNMNFVMDLSVYDFLMLHCESRMVKDSEQRVKEIIEKANELAGEKFDLKTQITSLSGGQSRALMISDTAFLSRSPIVLIDEIENAGIDRTKALKLLLSNEKIVLMATHDPLLALMADKRIVIKDGGISKILETTEEEKNMLYTLQKYDNYFNILRSNLRSGETIENILF